MPEDDGRGDEIKFTAANKMSANLCLSSISSKTRDVGSTPQKHLCHLGYKIHTFNRAGNPNELFITYEGLGVRGGAAVVYSAWAVYQTVRIPRRG